MIQFRRFIPIFLLSMLSQLATFAGERDKVLPSFGVDSTSHSFFKERYISEDLVHYLDQLNMYITWQTETTGQFYQPDQMVFSVDGNSFRWNKFYLDGFRINSRLYTGSTLYKSDMANSTLALDYIGSGINFSREETINPSISLSYNVGGLGGISSGTASIIHLFHKTASDRVLFPINDRSKVKGSGNIDLNYGVKGYNQRIYASFGQRMVVDFDNDGINNFYPEDYSAIQLEGELPLTLGQLFDKTSYIASYSGRDNLYSEFNYAMDETAKSNNYGLSFYGSKREGKLSYTSGLTFGATTIKHNNLNFSRNLIDQDGEGFEPWYGEGTNFEYSHSLTLQKEFNEWLTLNVDCYNSLLSYSPSATSFQNATYAELIYQETPTMHYLYEWESRGYMSGLLENSVGLSFMRPLGEKVDFKANIDLTLDGMIVKENSKISPNVEAFVGFDFKLAKWIDIQLNLARKRVSYSLEEIQFLSQDYMNGNIFFIRDENGDGAYQEGEKGDYFTSTGGKYHTLSSSLKQQSYYVVDIPINFTFGRHKIALLQSLRRHNNTWRVRYDKDASEYGYFKETKADIGDIESVNVFYLNGSEAVNYVVDTYPEGSMGEGFLFSAPYSFTSNVQYSYTAPKFMVSVGWQSYMVNGLSALGNGPIHNNIGVLSESSANPNTSNVIANTKSKYRASGRLDQDKAYVARIFASYNITENFSLAMNAKFKDGQPFSIYNANSHNNQLAILPETSRGTNSHDGNFGTREDAIFNIDLRATYNTKIRNRNFCFGLNCYNIYDFGNELSEYVFDQELDENRRAMSLTIPRGLIVSLKIDL